MKLTTQSNYCKNSARAAIGSHLDGKSVILRVTMIVGTVGLYMLIFRYLYHFRESGMWAVLAIIPMMFAGWFWGFWAGIGAALVCSVVNMPLIYLVRPSGWEFILRILLLSLVILVPIGGTIGRLRDLGRQLQDQMVNRQRVEEALRKERDHVQKYLDIAGVIMIVIHADQTVTLINKKGCEILGYTEEDIVGRNWFDTFLPEQERERVKAGFAMLMTGHVHPVEYFENTVLTKQGEEKMIAWHNAVLKDKAGNLIGTLSSGEDITERKQAEAELQRYRDHLEELVAKRTAQLRESEEKQRAQYKGIPVNVYLAKKGRGLCAGRL